MKNVRKLIFSAAAGTSVLAPAAVAPPSVAYAVQTPATPDVAAPSVVPTALVGPLACQRVARRQRAQARKRRTPVRSLLFSSRRAVRVRRGCS